MVLVGGSGVGKSLHGGRMARGCGCWIEVVLSGWSGSEETQKRVVDVGLERRRKGVYGPRIGSKCVLMVDDIHMARREEYGDRPVIELLR